MTWNRLRWTLLLVGLCVTVVGFLPIALLIGAIQVGGLVGVVMGFAALLLSPLLAFLRLGPFIIGAVWKGQQVVVMGRQWGQAAPPAQDPDVIDAEFQDD